MRIREAKTREESISLIAGAYLAHYWIKEHSSTVVSFGVEFKAGGFAVIKVMNSDKNYPECFDVDIKTLANRLNQDCHKLGFVGVKAFPDKTGEVPEIRIEVSGDS